MSGIHRVSLLCREYRPRENVTFLENGTKLYALNPKTFVFVPEKSAGNPEVDVVTTINIPFVVRKRRGLQLRMTAAISFPQTFVRSSRRNQEFLLAATFPPLQRRVLCLQAVMNELNSYSFFLRSMVSVYISSLGVDVFMNRTVHEILWGFKDPLLSKIHNMRPSVDEHFGLMWKVSVTWVQVPPSVLFLLQEDV